MNFDPRKSPGFLVGRVAHLFRLKTSVYIKERGVQLSPEECSVLWMVAGSPNPQRIGALAELLLRDATTVKRQLDSLIKHGFVERATDPADRRGVIISISEKGRDLLAKTRTDSEALRDQALAGISPQDAELLVSMLTKMLANLSA